MFSSVSQFSISFTHPTPFFTNVSLDIFPTTSPDAAAPDAPLLSHDDPVPPPSPVDSSTSTDAPISPLPPESPTLGIVPSDVPHRLTWVTKALAHLLNFHCYSTVMTQYEPHTYSEACSNPL